MVNLGDKVKDKVSGVIGIVVSRSDYLHGCIRVSIHPVGKQGKDGKWLTFDEPQLKIVEKSVYKSDGQKITDKKPKEYNGGPRPDMPHKP